MRSQTQSGTPCARRQPSGAASPSSSGGGSAVDAASSPPRATGTDAAGSDTPRYRFAARSKYW